MNQQSRFRFLFIGTIATKKEHFNGEANKSLAICDCLSQMGRLVSINLMNKKTQVFSMIRFAFLVCFGRFDYVISGKAPTGILKIIKVLRFLHFPGSKIICYPYGYGFHFYYEDKLDKKLLCYCQNFIVESPELKSDFEKFGCYNVHVFPCMKKIYHIPPIQEYSHKDVLNLLFFSRVSMDKGVGEAIDAVIRLNTPKIRFTLTIAGKDVEPDAAIKIADAVRKYPFIIYLEGSFTITGKESYVRFATYDLQVFFSKYFHECAPGSVVDSFIAGVPVISTRFRCCDAMLDNSFAYFVDSLDPKEIDCKLNDIYDHQDVLFAKRTPCSLQAQKYSYESFITFLRQYYFSH